MRWRLIAIITVPTVTALILGVIQIVGSVNNYSSFKRVQDLANLNSLVVQSAGLLAAGSEQVRRGGADRADLAPGRQLTGAAAPPPSGCRPSTHRRQA